MFSKETKGSSSRHRAVQCYYCIADSFRRLVQFVASGTIWKVCILPHMSEFWFSRILSNKLDFCSQVLKNHVQVEGSVDYTLHMLFPQKKGYEDTWIAILQQRDDQHQNRGFIWLVEKLLAIIVLHHHESSKSRRGAFAKGQMFIWSSWSTLWKTHIFGYFQSKTNKVNMLKNTQHDKTSMPMLLAQPGNCSHPPSSIDLEWKSG